MRASHKSRKSLNVIGSRVVLAGISDEGKGASCRGGQPGSAAGGLGGLGLLDELTLDDDLDLVADHELAVQHHVGADAEVGPVDLAAGAVGDPVPHHARVV